MKPKNTNDLQTELIAAPDLDRFLTENQDTFYDAAFADYLADLFKKKGLSKSTLAKKAGISNVYLHQIFSSERNPSRNRILCLCFGLSTSLEEAQQLLKHGGYAQLCVKNKRDAIIFYALSHDMNLDKANDLLFSEQEKTLY